MVLELGENSYVEVEDADEYFAAHLFSNAWDISALEIKEKALLHACRNIEALVLRGSKTSSLQLMQFPRDGDLKIPTAIKDAQCEEAIALLEVGDSYRYKLQKQGVKQMQIGGPSGTQEQFSRVGAKRLISDEAKFLLAAWILGAVKTSR